MRGKVDDAVSDDLFSPMMFRDGEDDYNLDRERQKFINDFNLG